MNKRVYGIIGISSILSNWNADFSGYPKTLSDGTTFGSDKALKYPMKKMWEDQGEKVLYIKSFKLSTEKKGGVNLVPRTLSERYEYLFNVPDLENTSAKEILENLFCAIDVKNFGATFAAKKKNISITGAVQIGQGLNFYADTNPEEQQILSPFRDGTKDKKENSEEAKNSTLGTKIVSNEAHYFYPFVVNPLAYKEYQELGVTDGYTEDDYAKFKAVALKSATAFATNAKIGCENEFALFVETDPDVYLPNLSAYMEFEKGEEKNTIGFSIGGLLNSLQNQIQKVEIYYNPNTTEIKTDVENVKQYHIFTQKEV